MLVALSAGLALTTMAWAGEKDPYVGTWTLDVARTTYDPGPVPRSSVDVITTTADGSMHVVQESIAADGTKIRREWTARFDGKDYPVTGGAPGTTISLKYPDPKDPWTYDWVWKVPGVSTTTGRAVFSRDGKTRVIDEKAVDGSGKTTTVRHRVYVRQ